MGAGAPASLTDMLSITRVSSPDLPVTRIVPLPSPSLPVSQGIDIVVEELESLEVNTMQLHETAQKMDFLTTRASEALHRGDMAGVQVSLGEAVNTMREAIVILKLLCIIERNRLPGHILEHMVMTREFIQQAMAETSTLMYSRKSVYSSAA
jgi:hypothetical protein